MLVFLGLIFTKYMEFLVWICFVIIAIVGIVVGNFIGGEEFNLGVALIIWVIGMIFLTMTFGAFGAIAMVVKNTHEILDYLRGMENYCDQGNTSFASPTEQTASKQEEEKEETSTFFCVNCGRQLNEGVKFCVGCGAATAE